MNASPIVSRPYPHHLIHDPRAALKARLAGSRIGELVCYGAQRGERGLNEVQLRRVLESIVNTTRFAVELARVAMAKPEAPRAFICKACHKQQDIDGGCINCGLSVRPNAAFAGKAAA